MWDGFPTVKRGSWLYAGTVRVPFRIVLGPVTYGSGDYEDPPDVREDRDVPCSEIVYQTYDGHEVGGGGAPTLQQATDWVEKMLGKSVTWDE